MIRQLSKDKQRIINGLPTLGAIWLMGAVVDRVWFSLDQSMPAWDQAEYLAGALNYWQALQTPQVLSSAWWTSLWQLSSKIPPLVYLSTTPFLSLFGPGLDQSTVVNLVFSAILLASVYGLGVVLFTPSVGLWGAAIAVLMPGLYRVRLDYLMDYPLAAMVTLSFFCITLWRSSKSEAKQHPAFPLTLHVSWLLAIAVGVTLGLALMVKQPALLFLLVPFGWTSVESLAQRSGRRLVQLALAVVVGALICGPWYRTNWLLILSSGKRATVDSAIAEGDPSLLSLDAWTYYLKHLPEMVSLPLLLVPIVGFLLFWRPSLVSSRWLDAADYGPKTKDYRQQVYQASRRSLLWLLGFCIGGYLLSSLNINKDDRYVVPYLPALAVLLGYGLTLLPKRWQWLRWGTLGLTVLLTIVNIFPIGQLNMPAQRRAYMGAPFPHADVVAEVTRVDPYLRSTIGVLPSTPGVNQHNINYYGMARNFQVYGRQVGTRVRQVEQDSRSLSWFITKTGDQGSIRQRQAQDKIVQQIMGPAFQVQRTWALPDGSRLILHRQRTPPIVVQPLTSLPPASTSPTALLAPIHLDRVEVPAQARGGVPIPVRYTWSGPWKSLQSGLILLTWRRLGTQGPETIGWIHDHAFGMGALRSNKQEATANLPFQVVERMAMLPPANAAGTYVLEATYLNRQTGEAIAIEAPPVRLQLRPSGATTPAPELDLVTQLRTLAARLPQGLDALDPISDEIARVNQYDPTLDYLDQTRQAMEFRLQQEPTNVNYTCALVLANVLRRRVDPAIAALQRLAQLVPGNPHVYAYLAFVNLYDFRPIAAERALETARQLQPNLPELHALSGVAALMRGNVMQAWRDVEAFHQASRS